MHPLHFHPLTVTVIGFKPRSITKVALNLRAFVSQRFFEHKLFAKVRGFHIWNGAFKYRSWIRNLKAGWCRGTAANVSRRCCQKSSSETERTIVNSRGNVTSFVSVVCG